MRTDKDLSKSVRIYPICATISQVRNFRPQSGFTAG
jgi:hypothetical protein